jgi:hypothetical protein
MTKPIYKHFTVGLQLVDGWNNVEDNNGGKTLGLTTAWTGKKISWCNNDYAAARKPTQTQAGGTFMTRF